MAPKKSVNAAEKKPRSSCGSRAVAKPAAEETCNSSSCEEKPAARAAPKARSSCRSRC